MIVLVLILWRAFMATFASFFGWRKSSKEIQNTFVLSWNKHYFDISFKDRGLDGATLADLKQRCKELTGVPIATMKLTISGGTGRIIFT